VATEVLRRPVSLGFVVWLVVGLVVAANHHFLDHLSSLSQILSAVLATLAWPLVVLHIHVAI
jgi:ABC-type anion transport system duplicated permease subunit